MFESKIALDFCVAQITKLDADRSQVGFGKPGGLAHHSQRSLKHDGLAAHALQLGHRAGMVAGFAKGVAMQIGHLI